jgi:hypothetical protein
MTSPMMSSAMFPSAPDRIRSPPEPKGLLALLDAFLTARGPTADSLNGPVERFPRGFREAIPAFRPAAEDVVLH